MTHAGDLRLRVNVEAYTVSTGDRGQAVKTWATATAAVPAMIEDLSGRKLELARQLVPAATHKITLRYLSTLTIVNRFNFGGRIFSIGAILNDRELNFVQECICEEQLGGG